MCPIFVRFRNGARHPLVCDPCFWGAIGFLLENRAAVWYAAGPRDVAGVKRDQITTAQPATDCPVDQKRIAFFTVNLVKHLEWHVDNEAENGFILSVRPASGTLPCSAVQLVLHQTLRKGS